MATETTRTADPSADAGPIYDAIVLSDLHLGCDVCQAKLLEEFLEWACENAREVIINGDIFDDLNFKRLSKRHFACLKVIRRNSDREGFRLIWLRGNHDGPAEVVSHIVGVEILDEYLYDNGQVQLLILHGDQFDTFITKHVFLSEIACGLFYFIQKMFPHRAARWVRRISKRWQRNSELVERRAVEHSRYRGCANVTCGHTHLPMVSEHDGVRYFNTGTWMEAPPCPFLTIRGDQITLETWPRQLEAPNAPAVSGLHQGSACEGSEALALRQGGPNL